MKPFLLAARLATTLFTLAATAGAPVAAQPAAPVQAPVMTGNVAVMSLPLGATVWLDGTYLGQTPLNIGAVPAGHHTVTLTKPGWTTQEFPVDAAGGTTILATRRLTAAGHAALSGTLVFHGPVDERTIKIDGRSVFAGSGPVRKAGDALAVSAGVHTISAVVGGTPVTRIFTVLAQTETMLVLDAATPRHTAALVAPAADSLPLGSVHIEGTKVVIHCRGHMAVGHLNDADMRIDGRLVHLDSPPALIRRELYLPVPVLEELSGQ